MTPPFHFAFSPRWKEELVVSCAQGSFVLPFWMGVPTVDLPPADRWAKVAPAWAHAGWEELHRALALWCRGNGAALRIDPKATVWAP